jgi:hypothetical protein
MPMERGDAGSLVTNLLLAVGVALAAAASVGPVAAQTWTQLAPVEAVRMSIRGLDGPEAVKYDPRHDRWIIANWAEGGDANDGFLTAAAAGTGAIEALRWGVGDEARPLKQPRGMALRGDTLWVADADGVHAFHRDTGDQLAFIDMTASEPGFLNDLAFGPDGALHVTDTGRSSVFRVHEGGWEIVAEGEELGSPNGITLEPGLDALVLVPWQGGPTLLALAPDGRTQGVATVDATRFDGVEAFEGGLVVAAQSDSALHVVRIGGRGRPFQKVPGRPADIAIDPNRRWVAVPYVDLDMVEVYALPEGAPPGR